MKSPFGTSRTVAAFFSGLVKPSAIAVATASTILALVIGLCLFGITPGFIAAQGDRFLPRGPTDHSAFVTASIQQMKASDDPRPLLIIVGTSLARASFGSEKTMEDRIREMSGLDVEVRNLSIAGQSLLQQIASVDEVLSDRPTTIVFSVGPGRFARAEESVQAAVDQPQLGFRSEVINDEARRMGEEPFVGTGNYFYDNRAFYLVRRTSPLKNLLFGPYEQNQVRWIGAKPRSPEAFRERALKAVNIQKDYTNGMPFGLEMLNRAVERYRQIPTLRIQFTEQVMNPVFINDYFGADHYAGYIETMETWAAEQNVNYSILQSKVDLSPEDFQDWGHIYSADAMAQMQVQLIKELEFASQ